MRVPTWLLWLLAAAPAAALTPQEMESLPIPVDRCGYDTCFTPVADHLNVHIVPHSHMELGVDFTYQEHLDGTIMRGINKVDSFNNIMSAVKTELMNPENPHRTFTLSATALFFDWWDKQSDIEKHNIYMLVRKGRLHFVGGGWSMTDEASASYQAIIDHHTLAMRRLNATLLQCGRPLAAWQAHNFGHSKEVASLLAQMGFHGLFINPIGIYDEVARMKEKSLEFVWRGNDHLGEETDIFTHKLFDGFDSPPGFCFGGLCRDPLVVSDSFLFENILERTRVFLEDCQYRQWPNYRTHHIMVIMGGMRDYYDASRWYENIDKLIEGVHNITQDDRLAISIQYSTPACYLKAVNDVRQSFPTKQDDFFPHMPTSRSYYVGQFTSRPSLKFMLAEANALLQITKQLQVLTDLPARIEKVEKLKWIVGVMQDHNILSGAMKNFVLDDYRDRLHVAVQRATIVIEKGLNTLRGTPSYVYYRCALNESNCNIFELILSSFVVYNPLAWPVTMPIRIPALTNRTYLILNHEDEIVPYSLMPLSESVIRLPGRSPEVTAELVFISRDIPPLGLTTYYIHQVHQDTIPIRKENTDAEKRDVNDKRIYTIPMREDKTHRNHVDKREAKNERKITFIEAFDYDNATKHETEEQFDDESELDRLGTNDEHDDDGGDEIPIISKVSTPAIQKPEENNKTNLWPWYMIPGSNFTINSTTVRQFLPKVVLQWLTNTTTQNTTHELVNGTIRKSNRLASDRRKNMKINYFEPHVPFYQEETDKYNLKKSNSAFEPDDTDEMNRFFEGMNITETNSENNKKTETYIDNNEEDEPLPDYESEITNETRRAENIDMNDFPIEFEFSNGMEATTRIIEEDTNIWKDKNLFDTYEPNKLGSSVLINNIEDIETETNKQSINNSNQSKTSLVNNQQNIVIMNETLQRVENNSIPANDTDINDDDDDGLDVEISTDIPEEEMTHLLIKAPSVDPPQPPKFNTNDNFIKSKYITLHTDGHTGLPAGVSLSGGARVRLRVSVGYYEADYPSRRADADPDKMDPGANNFATMFRAAKDLQPTGASTYVSADVSELHVTYAPWAALVLRLYRDAVALEVDWTLATVPAPELVGREMFIRYVTDLQSDDIFYTDANGRQTMKRIRSKRSYPMPYIDKIAGNIYPVTSKIYIEDTNKNLRFSVFNDRAQGGTSLSDGEITLFIHRRIFSLDAASPGRLNDVEPLRGKHYLYVSKADRNKVFEKKFAKEIALMPRIFANLVKDLNEWYVRRGFYNNELSTLTKRLPVGMHLLTLEKLDDNVLLLRLENFLEEGDTTASQQIVYMNDMFVNIRILSLFETTLSADQPLKNLSRKSWNTDKLFVKNFNKFYGSNSTPAEYSDNDFFEPYSEPNLDSGLAFKPQQIRTFIVTYEFKKSKNY